MVGDKERSDWWSVRTECETILEKQPANTGVLEIYAHALWHLGEYELVAGTMNTLVSLQPGRGGYRYTRGLALLMRGEARLASEDFAYVCDRCGDPELQMRSGEALHALVDWREASIGPLGIGTDGSSKRLADQFSWLLDPKRVGRPGGGGHN